MMTKTEAKAEALAAVFYADQDTFGKEQCQVAMMRISKLVKDGLCDDATADDVRAELGNHSAVRQWAVKQGFLSSEVVEDALAKHVKAAIAKIDGKTADQLPIG